MAGNHAATRIARFRAQILGSFVLERGDVYELEIEDIYFSSSIQTAFTLAELRAVEEDEAYGIEVVVHDNLNRIYNMSFIREDDRWILLGEWGTLTGSNNYREGTLVHLWWYRCPVRGYDSLSTLHIMVESRYTYATQRDAQRGTCRSCRRRFLRQH